MEVNSITGCWAGALLSDHGAGALPFSLKQPPRALSATSGPEFRIGTCVATSARLLDGAARVFVALVDDVRDPVSGRLAQFLVDARVRGDKLVGRWLRRDDQGRILESGQIEANRVGGAALST